MISAVLDLIFGIVSVLLTLNCQVWGSNTPTSKRNASISSAASVTDLSPSQGDPNYRGNLGEGWTTSRPTSGTWDDVNGSPQKKDFSQLVTADSKFLRYSSI